LEKYEKEQYNKTKNEKVYYRNYEETNDEYEESQWEKDHPLLSFFLPTILFGVIYGISWLYKVLK
jgi:hypothetical protein